MKIGTALAVLFAIVIILYIIHIGLRIKRGPVHATAKTLSRHAALHKFKTLRNRNLSFKDQTAYLENLMIGPFGILLLTTFDSYGSYYGTLEDKTWLIKYNEENPGGVSIPNPLREQHTAIQLLRDLFAKNDIYNVPIENHLCFPNRSKNLNLYLSKTEEVLAPGKLGALLQRERFEYDNGVDPQKIYDIILANSVEVINEKAEKSNKKEERPAN